RSQTVSRHEAEAEIRPQSPAVVRNWACALDLVHPLQPAGPHWMEVNEEAAPRLGSGAPRFWDESGNDNALSSHAAQRPSVERDIRCSTSALELDRLPSPRELCGKRKGRRRAAGGRRVMAVIYHQEELKRRQRVIDQLKLQKWGANRSPCPTQESEEWEKISPVQQPANSTRTEDLSTNTDLEDRQLFFQPRWNFMVPDQHPARWDIPFLPWYRAEAEEEEWPLNFLLDSVQQGGSYRKVGASPR
ncbi:uncharacterized protein LOC144490463, partial [Mustelus asterias]